jgi:hypothetical protein
MRLTRRRAVAALALVAAVLIAAAALRARFAIPRVAPLVTASGRTLTGFCAAAVQLHCQKRIECGQMRRGQLAACIEDVGAECERALGWKLRARVLTVADEPQEECLEALADASCGALQLLLGDDEPGLLELTNRCELGELFVPRSGIGGACAETSDCTAGFCPGLAQQCHRCRPFVAVGGACQPGVDECDPARAWCRDGRCQPLTLAATGARCAATDECSAGLYCRHDGGVCTPRVATGAPCGDERDVCAEAEARCVAGRCRVRPFLLGSGAACREFGECKDGLYCRGTQGGTVVGRCARQGGAGDRCDRLDFGACRADAGCFGDRCRRLGAAGERCSGPTQCSAFVSCVPDVLERGFAGGAHCVADAAVGQACHLYLPCVASGCDGGRCVALLPGGASCRSSEQCDSHWCAGGVCYSPCVR